MKITQIITDYIMKSILTTKGDMVVRGDSVPEALTAVVVGKILKSNGVGGLPYWSLDRSEFTTKGDMTVRGDSVPERLAAVAANQVLRSDGVGAKPGWAVPFLVGANMKTGSYNFGTTGSEVITALGFKPGFVLFVARDDSAPGLGYSIGFGDGTSKMSMSAANDDGVVQIGTTNCITFERTAGNTITGLISAMGGDGFTVAHTLSGTCVALICWFAIG